MSIKGKAYIMGAYEHPLRDAPDKSTPQIHAECAKGALEDAGLTKDDIDGYFCAGDAPGFGAMSMIDYMGLRNVRHMDSTETGGSSYLLHVGHAAQAIAEGKCSVALVTLAGRPRQNKFFGGGAGKPGQLTDGPPEAGYENIYGGSTHNTYGMCAMRHMYEYGTTSEQLAWIKVAASHHAQYNEHAFLKDVVTVEQVVNSRMISDPLHLLDCCVVTDGGGALILTSADRAKDFPNKPVYVLGTGESVETPMVSQMYDFTSSTAFKISGKKAFDEAGIKHSDVDHLMIYDAFAHLPLYGLEDLGFVKPGEAKDFIRERNTAIGGKLPLNTNGGGLSYMHSGMYGMYALQESVRQMRGTAAAQVEGAKISVCHGVGGMFASSGTVIFTNEK